MLTQRVAIRLFQRRAPQYHRSILLQLTPQFVVQRSKPWHPILIVERNSVLHLFNVSSRMKIIRVQKEPVETRRDAFSHSCFTGSSDSHENHCFWSIIWHSEIRRLPEKLGGIQQGP